LRNSTLYTIYNWGYAHANRIAVLAKGLEVFRLRAIATDGRRLPSGNLSFEKEL
jgi:hypothetical protein